jgi:hypothetical protein
MFPLFPLGQIVATPGALAALERAKQAPTCFLARHALGDWGELEPTDVAENQYSVAHGLRLLSSYQTDAGERLWIITEADRSATTLLLPDEFDELREAGPSVGGGLFGEVHRLPSSFSTDQHVTISAAAAREATFGA